MESNNTSLDNMGGEVENKTTEKAILNEKGIKKDKKEGKYGFIVIIIAIILVVLLAFAIFRKLTKKEQMDFVSSQVVNVTHLKYGDIEKEISVTGTVQPIDNSTVTAKCSGELLEIFVRNGDEVKKGDKICAIDNHRAVDTARVNFEQARDTFSRYQRLFSSGNLSRQSYDDYKTAYERAKIEYDSQLEYANPVANTDGVIDGMELNPNTNLNIGQIICYINSEGMNEIKFGVSERVLQGINIGDEVKVNKQGLDYEAEVVSTSRQVNSQTGLFDVKAMIKTENNLASGIMAKCTFIYEKKKNIPYLSRTIVYYEGEEPYVYVLREGDVIGKVFIKTGIENDYNVEILEGLSDEDKIVSTWSNDLAEGALARVNIEETVIKPVFASEKLVDDIDTTEKVASISDIIIEEKVMAEEKLGDEEIDETVDAEEKDNKETQVDIKDDDTNEVATRSSVKAVED